MKDIQTVLVLITLQQGLCAFSWWVGGWWLGLSKRVSAHWMGAALATAAGLSLILLRGVWPPFLTLVVANLAIMAGVLAVRRGMQISLLIPVTDVEHATLFGLDAALLIVFLGLSEAHSAVAVIGSSVPIAWTLLRAAQESHQALVREGALATARVVATPLALLGLVFAVRALAGLIAPAVAARPLHEPNAFNSGIVFAFMVVGLMINLVLALMVVGRLVAQLQHLSERDALTGLLNRRALAPLLQREVGRLRRYGETYSLLMIDVDHFKNINDQHGHAAGDAALRKLADVLRGAAREVDHVARLGGEEFCILLPHADLDGAMHLAERVHVAVCDTAWDEFDRPVTISVGVAVAQSPDEPPQAVLARADQALYRAKQAGRNQIVLAEAPRGEALQPA
ncbi:MAG TPA: GGDEF domain-containing protein [Burkholderiaceae bacterium]|nr:GGDEF domain-containing protein [Burkholderiaceae bacterium]